MHQPKNEGSALIIALLLGMMLLSMGLLGVKMMIKQVEFSSSLLLSVRAHYAAESGVERALFALKKFPVRHFQEAEFDVAQSSATVNINNKKNQFEVAIPTNGNTKLRLFTDKSDKYNDITFFPTTADEEKVNTFRVTRKNTTGDYKWKILCDSSGSTVSLINNSVSTSAFDQNSQGITSGGTPISIQAFIDGNNHCFLTLENLSSNELKFQFTTTGHMPPEIASVKVEGKSQEKTKVVEFEYRQKNLGGLFDFTLFHQE